MIKKAALTLLELMVTIAIMGVILCYAEVSLGDASRYQNIKSAAEQLNFALNKTKYNAKLKGEKTTLKLTTNTNKYSIESNGKVLTSSNSADSFTGNLPDNILILSNTCGSINFYADGDITDSNDYILSNCQIKIGYTDGLVKMLNLKPGTGEFEYD